MTDDEELRSERAGRTTAALLAELRALAPLPDEEDPWWLGVDADREVTRFMVLSGLLAERRARAAIPLLLGRASYGDFGETMRGLRHTLEAIVAPDWPRLASRCVEALGSRRRGTRLWAVDQLGVLRDRRTLSALLAALDDDADRVRTTACSAAGMVARAHPDLAPQLEERLVWYARRRSRGGDAEGWCHEPENALELLGELAAPGPATRSLLDELVDRPTGARGERIALVARLARAKLTARAASPPPKGAARRRRGPR